MEHIDLLTEQVDFPAELLEGLRARPKATSPKHLYDARGSELFDIECEQPEYYLFDAESEIMERHAGDIAERVGATACIIEPGSGASRKVRALLDVMDVDKYVPIDISTDFLKFSAGRLQDDFPGVSMECISADFTQLGSLPEQVSTNGHEKVVYFPGSTIGNFERDEARSLLSNFKGILEPSGYLIISVDLKKSPEVLERAYNDEAGVGASFHLNLLSRANREAGADFDPSGFAYRAIWNPSKGRMEMYLVSGREQEVSVDGTPVTFAEEEAWHTQSSHKYSPEEFRRLAAGAGFTPAGFWSDAGHRMSIQLFRS